MVLLGKYEVHHTIDGGLIRDHSCTKCKRIWKRREYWFSFKDFYWIKVRKSSQTNRKGKLRTREQEGRLREGYSSWTNNLPDQVIIVAELFPKWKRRYRILALLGLVGIVFYIIKYVL